MVNQPQSDVLIREWKRSPTADTPWPGTLNEFLAFLQTKRKALLATHFTLYDTLSGLQQRGIISLGGAVRFAGTPKEKFSWTYHYMGEEVTAFGKTREEAAMRALLVLWELIVRRQQQG
jgi:hypothetical protein